MAIYDQPARLLQTLIRFNTTNPPGTEGACIRYLDGILQEADLRHSAATGIDRGDIHFLWDRTRRHSG